MSELLRTPLFPCYAALSPGVRCIDFGGWELPVQFTGIQREHETVRTAAGLFDVSHMGEFIVSGRDALPFLQTVTTNDVAALQDGQAQYSLMCRQDGGTVDDLLVYRLSAERYMLVVNAANIEGDLTWLNGHRSGDVRIEDRSPDIALIAIQGPKAEDILARAASGAEGLNRPDKADDPLGEERFGDGNGAGGRHGGSSAYKAGSGGAEADESAAGRNDAAAEGAFFAAGDMAAALRALAPFRFVRGAAVCGVNALVSRTGYTGEDGFELYVRAADAVRLWNGLLEAGAPDGLEPAGLGARDTLRFEARLPLYGQELSSSISPLEAGLGYFVKLDKGHFIGREALAEQKRVGPARRLVGLEMLDRGIPRPHYAVYSAAGQPIGEVTSGTQSPTLKRNLGLALIDAAHGAPGTELLVDIRGKRLKAQVVKAPFYRKQPPGGQGNGGSSQ